MTAQLIEVVKTSWSTLKTLEANNEPTCKKKKKTTERTEAIQIILNDLKKELITPKEAVTLISNIMFKDNHLNTVEFVKDPANVGDNNDGKDDDDDTDDENLDEDDDDEEYLSNSYLRNDFNKGMHDSNKLQKLHKSDIHRNFLNFATLKIKTFQSFSNYQLTISTRA